MKLKVEDKNKLREQIRKLLIQAPEGKKIHIDDKELLEDLLFDTFTYKYNGINNIVRLPIWSGSFLRKIDLSEVSFDDVAWSLLHDEIMSDELASTFNIPEDEIEKIDEINKNIKWYKRGECPKVDYSLTNAKIDFTKSFEFKKTGGIRMENCDFFGVDFSNISAVGFKWCSECDLADTGLKITPEMFPQLPLDCFVFSDTNLTNLDLSSFNVDMVSIFDMGNYFWDTCDFTNTGIKFTLDSQKLKEQIAKNYIKEEDFRNLMTRVSGCYINGTKILADGVKNQVSDDSLINYDESKDQLYETVVDDIKGQIMRG